MSGAVADPKPCFFVGPSSQLGRRGKVAGIVIGALMVGTLSGCVSLKAYKDLEFSKQKEESARREAEKKLVELEQRLREEKPESEIAIKGRQELEDQVVRLEEAVARLEEEKDELLESVDSEVRPVVFEFPPELRKKLKLEANEATGGLVLDHDILFTATGVQLKPSAQALLANLARALNTNELVRHRILVDGHTDSRPVKLSRSLNPDNWVLGARRAGAVVAALTKAGVAEGRMILRSFSFMRPIVAERPESPRNRRVEIIIERTVR